MQRHILLTSYFINVVVAVATRLFVNLAETVIISELPESISLHSHAQTALLEACVFVILLEHYFCMFR